MLHPDGEVRAETVGKPTPGTRVRISDAGEILIASDSVFLGYYKNAGGDRDGRWRAGGSTPATRACWTSGATWS